MKIRWTNTSIRLRITPPELAMLGMGETAEESLWDGGWKITILPNAEATCLRFDGPSVSLYLSRIDYARLAAPDAEGVYFHTEGTPRIRYFIEKDFPCAHPRPAEAMEPVTETFIAPENFEARKNAR